MFLCCELNFKNMNFFQFNNLFEIKIEAKHNNIATSTTTKNVNQVKRLWFKCGQGKLSQANNP